MDDFQAQMAYSALQVEGVIDNNGNLNQGVDIEKVEFSDLAEPLQKEIKNSLKQKHDEPVTVNTIRNIKYTEVKVEEKSFSQEQAEAIYEDLKRKKNYYKKREE